MQTLPYSRGAGGLDSAAGRPIRSAGFSNAAPLALMAPRLPLACG
jgi:hypothetical protein